MLKRGDICITEYRYEIGRRQKKLGRIRAIHHPTKARASVDRLEIHDASELEMHSLLMDRLEEAVAERLRREAQGFVPMPRIKFVQDPPQPIDHRRKSS